MGIAEYARFPEVGDTVRIEGSKPGTVTHMAMGNIMIETRGGAELVVKEGRLVQEASQHAWKLAKEVADKRS